MRQFSKLASIAAIAFVVHACASDSPADPTAPDLSPSSATIPQRPTVAATPVVPVAVKPLLRATAISANLTVSSTIGVFGGVIAIPQAGVTITVPPFAVLQPTTISVTARTGKRLSYDFAPHGIKFLAPLTITQDLRSVTGMSNATNVKLGYFANATNELSVTELNSVIVNPLTNTATSWIWHFSGYIFAGGLEEE